MKTTEERIKEFEEEIRKTPYHKGTEHYIGRLRAKIAKLKEEQLNQKTKGKGQRTGFALKKAGDATVVLVGPPSVGKSSLINVLTGSQSKVAEYDFTTLSVIPGVLKYKGAQIQLFDLPGIIKGAAKGKGRGKEILSVARGADLILIMVDVQTVGLIDQIKKELSQFGLRLDERPPQIKIKKKTRGGLKVIKTAPLLRLSPEVVKETAKEFRLTNAEITLNEDLTQTELIDALFGNRAYLPSLLIVNKIDLAQKEPEVKGEKPVLISVLKKEGLEELKEALWQKLGLLRVYLKPKDREPDWTKPLIIKKGTTIGKLLENLALCSKGEVERVKIFGPGAKFAGQEVSFSFQPQEGTMIQFLT